MERRTFLGFLSCYALIGESKNYQSRILSERVMREELGNPGQINLETPHFFMARVAISSIPLSPFWGNFGIKYKHTRALIDVQKSKSVHYSSSLEISFGEANSPYLRITDVGMDDSADKMWISLGGIGDTPFKASHPEHRQLAYKEALDTLLDRYQK